MQTPEFVLHIWPGKWSLPSIEPSCLAAVLYLQLTIPGRFSVADCTNPDQSPSGQLPFLTHGHRVVSPLPSIIKYVATATKHGSRGNPVADPDSGLNNLEKAQRVAWYAHAESNLGDLLAFTFFSLYDNYARLIRPTLASLIPIPRRYYVPGRLRESYRPRLEAAGLWNLSVEEPKETTSKKTLGVFAFKTEVSFDEKGFYKRTFEREKVSEKADSILRVYAHLLSNKEFFFHDRPTALDVLVASHVLLFIAPPFPDRLLTDLTAGYYPTLTAHAHRVYEHAFPTPASLPSPVAEAASLSHVLHSLLPNLRGASSDAKKKERDAEDVRFERMRWGFFALAVGTVVVFSKLVGLGLGDIFPPVGELDDDEEGAEEEGEEMGKQD